MPYKTNFGEEKDTNNNFEGLYYGLNNPEKDCKTWLENLDINTNTWKKNENLS